MDHFSAPALKKYLKRFENAFEGHKSSRSLFNDSYEVYNASWTPGFFDEFLKRRGYDLRMYLRAFSGDADPDVTARLKSDYRLSLSELLLENFTLPWTLWSHEHGSLTRNQAHGSPGNLLDLYAAVDIPECEIYGHETFDMMLKLATSAAHVTNKSLISNETFTWLGEHSFQESTMYSTTAPAIPRKMLHAPAGFFTPLYILVPATVSGLEGPVRLIPVKND